MKFSLNWMRELVDLNGISLEQLLSDMSLKSIEIEGYSKMLDASKLVVGEVLKKEKHPNADKLSVCQVNLGDKVSQIICGAPNVDEGQKVIVALDGAILPGDFKIKKSNIRGIESNGMICSLAELGIDSNFVEKAYQDGIYVLDETASVGKNAIEELGFDDYSIELGITPNRSDLLSMVGIAQDLKAMYGKDINYPEITYHTIDKNINDFLKIKIESPNCLAYYAMVVEGITIKESPKWMKARLIAGGIRPINNVVDISNYVLLEYGQPLHTFDFDKLNSNQIVVRNAVKGETMVTLDEQKRDLLESDLLITDGSVGVALAGVMGGLHTEIDQNTKRVLIESAVFDPKTIRKTSSRLNLRSEASLRFERMVDVNKTETAVKRTAQLLALYADAKIYDGLAYVDHTDKSDSLIDITLQKVNQFLGTSITNEEFESILNRLEFGYSINDSSYRISVPKRRPDIEHYQDIIEEVARIYGYENIQATIPIMETVGKRTVSQKWRKQIKDSLREMGLSQIITYSLTKKDNVAGFEFELPSGFEYISLSKPMSEDKSILRTTLIPSALEVLQHNKARQMPNMNVFELGKRYYLVDSEPKEEFVLVGALHNIYEENLWQEKVEKVDFYLVKGIIEKLFNRLDLQERLTFTPLDKDYDVLHPNRQAHILFDRKQVGYVAQIHPNYAKKFNLKDVYVFSINMKSILERKTKTRRFVSIPKYPNVERDLAIVVDQKIIANDLLESIKKAGKRLLKDVSVFDLYQGENVEKGKKSIAFKLIFNSPNKTLTDDEINVLIQNILDKLEQDFNASLRA